MISYTYYFLINITIINYIITIPLIIIIVIIIITLSKTTKLFNIAMRTANPNKLITLGLDRPNTELANKLSNAAPDRSEHFEI